MSPPDCRDPGSNRGHLDLQSNALPAELSRRDQPPQTTLTPCPNAHSVSGLLASLSRHTQNTYCTHEYDTDNSHVYTYTRPTDMITYCFISTCVCVCVCVCMRVLIEQMLVV